MRPDPFADSPEFRRLAGGEAPVDLARIALEIAADAYPALDIEAYLARIAGLAERVRPRYRRGASARDILGQINWVLFVEEELRGNEEEYYDPRNSYLNEVLDRRLGIPISLSVLYRAVAEPLGLSVAGANLPAHFMLRVDDGDQTWFVDAFRSGAVMSREACRRRLSEILQQPVDLTDEMTAPCPVATVVTRMLRNLKAIHLRRGSPVAAAGPAPAGRAQPDRRRRGARPGRALPPGRTTGRGNGPAPIVPRGRADGCQGPRDLRLARRRTAPPGRMELSAQAIDDRAARGLKEACRINSTDVG